MLLVVSLPFVSVRLTKSRGALIAHGMPTLPRAFPAEKSLHVLPCVGIDRLWRVDTSV